MAIKTKYKSKFTFLNKCFTIGQIIDKAFVKIPAHSFRTGRIKLFLAISWKVCKSDFQQEINKVLR